MKIYAINARIFRGKKSFNQAGQITSENQTIDLPTTGSLEWKNFMKNATNVGYTEIEVIKTSQIIYVDKKTTYKEVDTPDSILEELKEAFDTTVKVELTPEQKKIKAMEAQIAELLGSKGTKKEVQSGNGEIKKSKEIDDAKAEYLKVVGKKAHHLMSLKKINEAIKEAK